MSSSRVEDTYEAQNDDRLGDLHSKLRTLRGVHRLLCVYRSISDAVSC
jgi:hypothetical protein